MAMRMVKSLQSCFAPIERGFLGASRSKWYFDLYWLETWQLLKVIHLGVRTLGAQLHNRSYQMSLPVSLCGAAGYETNETCAELSDRWCCAPAFEV